MEKPKEEPNEMGYYHLRLALLRGGMFIRIDERVKFETSGYKFRDMYKAYQESGALHVTIGGDVAEGRDEGFTSFHTPTGVRMVKNPMSIEDLKEFRKEWDKMLATHDILKFPEDSPIEWVNTPLKDDANAAFLRMLAENRMEITKSMGIPTSRLDAPDFKSAHTP